MPKVVRVRVASRLDLGTGGVPADVVLGGRGPLVVEEVGGGPQSAPVVTGRFLVLLERQRDGAPERMGPLMEGVDGTQFMSAG
jgi:hypothetical protein